MARIATEDLQIGETIVSSERAGDDVIEIVIDKRIAAFLTKALAPLETCIFRLLRELSS